MAAINNVNAIRTGKILYHVTGARRDKITVDDITKEVVLSNPSHWFMGRYCDSLFFEVEITYRSHHGLLRTYTSHHSVLDCGIGRKYNLNRIFETREAAEEFVRELQANEFSDPTDNEVRDRTSHDKFMFDEFDDFEDDYSLS